MLIYVNFNSIMPVNGYSRNEMAILHPVMRDQPTIMILYCINCIVL